MHLRVSYFRPCWLRDRIDGSLHAISLNCRFSAESVARRCIVEEFFLKNLQNSQENSCARISILIKLEALGLQFY